MTRRLLKIVAWIVGLLIGIPVLLVALVLIAGNTGPGQRALESLARSATGGEIRLEGLSGRFPDRLHIGRLAIADAGGVWLTVEDATLDWSPTRLLSATLAIDTLDASHITVARMPLPSSKSSGGMPAIKANLAHLMIDRLDLEAPVAGRPIALSVQGAGALTGPETGELHLAANALPAGPGQDHYTVVASLQGTRIHASIAVAEGVKGLLAGIAGLPDLGPTTIAATADGPTNALATQVTLAAGPLRAAIDGTVDTVGKTADLAVSAEAPAMRPRPDVAWSSIRLKGSVHGPFLSPAASATLTVDNLTAAGAAIGALHASLTGVANGETTLHATADNLRVPGPSPGLLANGPLTLDASARLQDPKRPIQFKVAHALFTAEGNATDLDAVHVHLTVPDLTPLAAMGGVDVHGETDLTVDANQANGTIDLAVKGGVGVTQGPGPAGALVGNAGTIDLAASVRGEDVTVNRLALSGKAFNASATGHLTGGKVDADWTLGLTNLGALRPGASGTLDAHGNVAGPLDSLTLTADLTGGGAAEGGRIDHLTAHLGVTGLPKAPSAQLTASGTVLDAPLSLDVAARFQDGGFHVTIGGATWKSLTAGGSLDLAPGATLPTGKITLAMPRLADLDPLLGRKIAGGVTVAVDATDAATRINAAVTGAALPGTASIDKATLDLTVTDPGGTPAVDGTLKLDGFDAKGVRASAQLTAKGLRDAVALTVAADSAGLAGAPARLRAAGTLDVAADASAEALALASLEATWSGETVRLLNPARIVFASAPPKDAKAGTPPNDAKAGTPPPPGITVDRLRLGLRQGVLAIDGRWGTALDLRASLTNLPADILTVLGPAYAADGTLSGEARLTGTPVRPSGTIRLAASRVRARTGPGRALPAANLTVDATLNGASARLDGKLTAGTSNVSLAGTVPEDFAGPIDLRIGGALDVALVNPLLQAQGMDAKGRATLDLGVGGTVTKPRASGSVRLTNGDFQNYSIGTHITAISAALRGDGDVLRIEQFSGRAGTGTVSASGTLSLAGTPTADLTVRASDARLLASDLANARVDANLTIRGPLSGLPALGGSITVREADIRVPEKLPPSIAVLPVREAGKPPPKAKEASAPPPGLALNLTLDAPARIYIRGRGIDAELGGRVVFTGTTANPRPEGGLHLRRGTFSLVGQTLNMTEGTIDFSGGGLTNPQLKLVATSTTAAITATLTISGDVKDPKIVLSSVPDLPQDEILSQLLFNSSKAKLSAFQLAEIASALASLSGVGSPLGDPLEKLRTSLGLDQLSVGSDASGGATLQAGRYIAPGVRVGATQGTGGNTQATVQIDIAKGLKLETTAGTASSADTAAGSTNGASVGLKYQLEY